MMVTKTKNTNQQNNNIPENPPNNLTKEKMARLQTDGRPHLVIPFPITQTEEMDRKAAR